MVIETVPEPQRSALVQNFNAPSILVFAPIMERFFTLLGHVFATVLVYASVVRRKLPYFAGSFLFKTAIDALVPSFSVAIAESKSSLITIYEVETVIAVFGLLGLFGTIRLRGHLEHTPTWSVDDGTFGLGGNV